MSARENNLPLRPIIIKQTGCKCDRLALAQAAERERARREEIDKLKCLALTMAQRLEELIKES